MIRLIAAIVENLRLGKPVVQATILSHAGSTPRTAGAKMVVCSDGSIVGTIGGGLVEAEVMRTAAELLGGSASERRSYDLNLEGRADTLDMLCGGRLEVLLEAIAPADDALRFYSRLGEALAEGQRGLVVTQLPESGGPCPHPDKHLVDGSGASLEGLPPAVALPSAVLESALHGRAQVTYPCENPRYLIEPLFVPGTVVLLGAGHVSQAVAALAHTVGFRIVVRDDRAQFANRDRFPGTDQIDVIASFEESLSGLAIDADSYLVIVTRGHRHDGTALARALDSRAGYIGMIGSRRKRDAIYEEMRRRGFDSRDLARVHSPIGLTIGAETPEEIAVSIVAELIAARCTKDRRDENAALGKG